MMAKLPVADHTRLATIYLKCRTIRISGLSTAGLKEFYCTLEK